MIWSFLGGTVVGFYVGVLFMCILAVSKQADDRAEEMSRTHDGKSN